MIPIKLVIFDFGDVIGHFNIEHFNRFVELNGGEASATKAFFKKNKANFDIDVISEKEFWTRLGLEAKMDLPWKIIARNNRKNLMINYKMVHLIKRMPIKKVMLSNMDLTTSKQIKQELQLKSLFPKTYFSYELKKNKMDKNVLDMICTKQNVKPRHVLFIDDFNGNIQKANDYGFQTIQFTDYLSLKNKLVELRIVDTK